MFILPPLCEKGDAEGSAEARPGRLRGRKRGAACSAAWTSHRIEHLIAFCLDNRLQLCVALAHDFVEMRGLDSCFLELVIGPAGVDGLMLTQAKPRASDCVGSPGAKPPDQYGCGGRI